ncbi:MAG: DEAD/DEAH box helicase [Sarcina sp.]
MNEIKFKDLGLKETLLKSIEDMGFDTPSQIQAQSIPIALEGFDIIGQAQTGTGKTAAFGCALINNLDITSKKKYPKALILAPTRELAIQVNDELHKLGKHDRLTVLPIYGGQPIDRQLKSLRQGVDVVVGTPGRVLDHIRRKSLILSDIDFLVLDEADEMLNMGFIDDLEEIVKSLKSDRQTLLFSATMPNQIKNLAKNYMKEDTKHVAIKKTSLTVSKITQKYFQIKHRDRFETLCRVIDFDMPTAAIIFCKTKRGVDEVVDSMQARGFNVEGMHGDMTQKHRSLTLKKFKDGNLDFLVATDVAARGIDVERVSHVFNYDLPQDIESYVHRIGRTGRANREGTAYSLVTPKELSFLKQIMKHTKSDIVLAPVPSAKEIFESKFKNIVTDIKNEINDNDFEKFAPIIDELSEEFEVSTIAKALVKLAFNKKLNMDYSKNNLNAESNNSSSDEAEKRVFISVGKRDGLTPKLLVTFLADTARISPKQIGDINIMENFCFANISSDAINNVMDNCIGKRLNRRKVNIEFANKKR